LTEQKRKELQEKILKTHRRRKMVLAGLIIGIALTILGQLLSFTAFYITGFTIFIICTGATSFFTILKQQYAKALKTEMEEEAKPPSVNMCPRCGTKVRKNLKYCPKCGKKIKTKKR
jgi:hypothetical protein